MGPVWTLQDVARTLGIAAEIALRQWTLYTLSGRRDMNLLGAAIALEA